MTPDATPPGREVRGVRTVAETWELFGLLMGRKRRRLFLQPVLGTGIAVAETVLMLALVRMLLLLSEDDDRTELALAGLEVELSFGQITAIALGASFASLVVRIADAQLAAANLGLAIRNIREAVIRSWFEADWEQSKGDRLGRLQQLLGVNSMQAVIPINLVVVGSTAVISLLLYSTIIVVSAPVLAAMLVVIGVASAAAMTPFRRRTKEASQAHSDLLGDLQLSATSYALLNRELHVFGGTEAASGHLVERNRRLAGAFRRVRFLQRLTPGVYSQVMFAGVVALVALSHVLDVSAATFGVMAVLGVRSLTYVQMLDNLVQQHIEARPFITEAVDAITHQRAMSARRGDRHLDAVRRCELRDVSYEYEPGTPALRHIDLRVDAGERLGVVGPSGGGKTTLCNVVAGLLTPTEGEYLVNDAGAREYSATSWAAQLGLLSQEPALLRATIGENIAFHRDASTDEIRRAAAAAGILDVIDALPRGLDTPVGEGSSTLSGGQRQRIALARTILARPTCVILDEPTSALDSANEERLRESLAGMDPETIVIVVSHRRALLEDCTRFVAVVDGRIVADEPADQFDLTSYVGATPGAPGDRPYGVGMETTGETA